MNKTRVTKEILSLLKKTLYSILLKLRRFSIKEQMYFAKRLSFLINSGVPLVESLNILRNQSSSQHQNQTLQNVIVDVNHGKSLSESLARIPFMFSNFTIGVIRIGEASGTLSKNLAYLAEELKKKYALKRKVLGALVYPLFITVATIGISGLLTIFIFPKVMPVFLSLKIKLPLTTQILLFISEFLQKSWGLLLLLCFIFLACLLFTYQKSAKIRYTLSRTILRLPIVGTLVQSYNMTDFCRTLSLLLQSGFSLNQAIKLLSDTTINPIYKKEYDLLLTYITRGEKIGAYFHTRPQFFPSMLSHMVSVGETSGTLSESLLYLSEYYESEVDDKIKNLSSAVEPILMVFMGLVVGFVAVSVITPIYEITQNLSR